MIPRRPALDFADVPFHWAENREFATDLNASSPVAAQSEPYLNTVMATVRKQLPEGALRDEIDIFIKQEANHYALHNKFNDEMYRRGYEEIREIELELRDDFRRMLKTRSIKFNAAYCAGFENLALFLCKFIFYRALPYFNSAEKRMADLFLWHYSEEFEHRSVAHHAFAHVSGNYFRRVHGAFYAFFHLARYKSRIKKVLFEVDRAAMSPEEAGRSRRQERALNVELAGYVLPRMFAVLIPYYDPGRAKLPEAVRATLARFETTAT